MQKSRRCSNISPASRRPHDIHHRHRNRHRHRQNRVQRGPDRRLGRDILEAVQSGLEEETDTEIVARLSGRPVLPEAYRLQIPASPHLSAEAEGAEIDTLLDIPEVDGPLVVEGAGGLMVPLNRQVTYLDVFARWQRPVILCARTQLGTINHTLLSLRALPCRRVPCGGGRVHR